MAMQDFPGFLGLTSQGVIAIHAAGGRIPRSTAATSRCAPLATLSRRLNNPVRSVHLARRLDLVDAVVTETAIARLAMPDAADLLVDDKRPDAAELRQEALALRSRLDQLAVDFADGAITNTQLRTATERLRGRLRAVEASQAAIVPPTRPCLRCGRGGRAGSLGSPQSRGATGGGGDTDDRHHLPAGKGGRFDAEHVRIEWKTG